MSKIALLPGGFKPPHAGHYNMAKWLSANTGADTTIIFVGPKERDGITQAMSLKLWELYTQNDSGLEVRPAGVSPVRDVYDFIEQEAPQGSTVFLGMGEKDVSDTRFKNIPKFAEPKGITFETKLVPPQAGGVSGTEMRGFIKMNDKALFQYSLPEHLSDEQKNEAWDIVTGLKESGADTSWEDEDGNKITLQDVLDLTKNIPTKNYPTEKLAKVVLNWDDNPEEVDRISQVEISKQYPILIMVDESGKIQWILDGNHRAQKALRAKAETIPAKLIKPSNLDARAKKIFNLEEDLYNPEDKVLDYMRGSEWKAGMPDGPKDDIPRTKNQIHNRQTNPHAHMSEDDQSETGKILHAYDFDDTIAQVQANIKVFISSPSGDYNKEILIPAANFPEESKELEARLGSLEIKYDFSEFEKQIGDAIVNSKVVNKLKDSLSRPEVKTTILTARSIGHPVTRYMREELGLAAYVVPLGLQVDGKVTGQDKADWIEKHINKGYKTVYFIDDSEENRTAVAALKDKHPDVNLTVEDPSTVNEMMGMMTKQEKAKHAKNMKRLSKDMSNLKGNNYGGGGYKVPDYVKGTLTRKLYKERDLSDKEEKIAKDLPDSEFKKRYGKNWKSVKIATATKLAKNENYPPYKADQVQKVRYQASDTFTNSPKDAKKKGYLQEKDPKKGTGKKPKGSSRRLYTDENPKDTVKVKFSTRQDIVDTLNKASFKNKSHKRQSQVINLIHQRVRAALGRAKDPAVKKRLKPAFEYIKKRKEASKKKTQRMKKESVFSKDWWKTQLTEVITETKANTHLTHLEELILTQGQDGFNQAKNFLYELIKNLKGQDNSIKNVSVKWDGAPAVFTGINPDNGQFFVGTKSVFNKEPKINYTPKDIDENHGHAAGLAKKLKLALQYLPSIGIKGILQGDLMFDNDEVETEDIEGVSHYTFKPNTIRYAVEANSELGKQIIAARIGIIFHTTYKDLSGGGASFGADVSGLSKSPSVWFDDAFFKDDTGILLSEQEEKFVLEKINEADSINVDYTNLPLKSLNTYINSEIRQGEFLDDPSKSFERFKNWYQRAVDKSIEKVKRPESKERKRQAGEEKLREFNSQKQDIVNIFKVSKLLSEAKAIFITKYDKAVATKHFIDNGDGTLSVTKAEGFVAVDHTENGIKLVDRLEFSKNNFNAGKPGAKK